MDLLKSHCGNFYPWALEILTNTCIAHRVLPKTCHQCHDSHVVRRNEDTRHMEAYGIFKLFLSQKLEAQGSSLSQWSAYLAGMKPWTQSLSIKHDGTGRHLNTWGLETKESEVQGHLWHCCEFEASFKYVRLSSRK